MKNSLNTQISLPPRDSARTRAILACAAWFLAFLLVCLPGIAFADMFGEKRQFSVDAGYDEQKREAVAATLRVVNSRAYVFVEDAWWDSLQSFDQYSAQQSMISLAAEFEQKIYPAVTQAFGPEWNPGIDGDEHITILFHAMRQDSGGYTNYGDEYSRFQNPESNEREMVYLNLRYLASPLASSYLAHEFTHLVTFNQKELAHGIKEDVWLNEGRADYAPTLLGYDVLLSDSNIKRRIRAFLDAPTGSLVEWSNDPEDYGMANLFVQYVVDQYGARVLADSLNAGSAGAASLEEGLRKGGFSEDFEDVFLNWTIALFLNDCSYGERYCYHNPQLVNLRVAPQTNFLPSIGDSTLIINSSTKDWAPNWLKVIGGKEVVTVEFKGNSGGRYVVPYLAEDMNRKFSIHALNLNERGEGAVTLEGFNKNTRALVFMPIAAAPVFANETAYPARLFSFTVSTAERTPEEEQALIAELTIKLEGLRKEIARIQAILAGDPAALSGGVVSCAEITRNLFLGLKNSEQVKCLQEFLFSEGVYDEGLVTGGFFAKTLAAVKRFQEKYASEILVPIGLSRGTGFVGEKTREKINELLTRK
ncbi:MAG: hypothetical protein HY482_00790 [Candidatus Wildermuthbacteria bacterium]|nr:hypothetical protein [Candidatus Wildermuthbacteria bacterium]